MLILKWNSLQGMSEKVKESLCQKKMVIPVT